MGSRATVCTGIDNIVNRRHNRKSTFIAAFSVLLSLFLFFCGKTRKFSRLQIVFKGWEGVDGITKQLGSLFSIFLERGVSEVNTR